MAVLDLTGSLVTLRSGKGLSLRKALEFISRECTPLMVASDVSSPPRLLEKVSAAFSVPVYAPRPSMSRLSKSRIIRQLGVRVRGSHKRDALAAAVNAYDGIRPMLERIDSRLAKLGMGGRDMAGDVARLLIFGQANNIDRAVRILTGQQSTRKRTSQGIRRAASLKSPSSMPWLNKQRNRQIR